ncbi:MAG: DUF169 domain-containing protein [Lachnospiraceae bacterium]|nr:DUF169 domain-containing protein [Lachnospiraceae bacterium]
MLSDLAKEMFAKLELPYPAVAMKYVFEKPEGYEQYEGQLALCSFVKVAQEGRKFYISEENENCMGKMMLGMIDIPKLEGSGRAGYDFEVFKTPAPNARLYHMLARLTLGSCNYVQFAPVSECDFDPDLIICLATTREADLIMRANSYISGDLWESRDSHVAGCSWKFVYPYISGKINHSVVGMHHGEKRRRPFPDGLHYISIPYQKFNEVVQALSEMEWVPIAMREDEESKKEMERRFDHWAELDPEQVLKQA